MKLQELGTAFFRRRVVGNRAKPHCARKPCCGCLFVDERSCRNRYHDLPGAVPQGIDGQNCNQQA
jgi:hypothetical protein